MNSRILLLLFFLAHVFTVCSAQETQGTINASTILSYRIKQGLWKDAFLDNPDGLGFRYYFPSTALRTIATQQGAADAIQSYLTHCISRSDIVTGTWDDVPNTNLSGTQLIDADDSNIACFLLLATDYYSTAQGKLWWATKKNKLKFIVQKVLLENRRANGLVKTFSKTRNFYDPIYNSPRNPGESLEDYRARLIEERNNRLAAQRSAYLMDNCEVYAAFKAFEQVLSNSNDSDSLIYKNAAAKVSLGIAAMFHETTGAFYVLDTEVTAFPNYYPPETIKFYPHRLAQVFPQLFNVPIGDAARQQQVYDRAWAFATANGDWSNTIPADGSADGAPVMIRGYMSQKRGDTTNASMHLQWFLSQRDVLPKQPRFFDIHEVAYALRIQRGLLQSLGDTAEELNTSSVTE